MSKYRYNSVIDKKHNWFVQIFVGKITPNPPPTRWASTAVQHSNRQKNTMDLCRYLLEKSLQILLKLDDQVPVKVGNRQKHNWFVQILLKNYSRSSSNSMSRSLLPVRLGLLTCGVPAFRMPRTLPAGVSFTSAQPQRKIMVGSIEVCLEGFGVLYPLIFTSNAHRPLLVLRWNSWTAFFT